MINPFDYVRSINEKKGVEHLYDYNPYLANIAFSYAQDTILLANEMNRLPLTPPEVQYGFLYDSVRRGKRFNKWHKPKEYPHLKVVMDYYGYSKEKAIQALQVLSQSDIKRMIAEMDEGGK